jgi:hypothetical protein
MQKLAVSDLMSLERYSRERPDFRTRVIAHKRNRQLNVGPEHHVAVRGPAHRAVPGAGNAPHRTHLRSRGIAEELAAYNPLIPDGSNWKVTFLIEYTDPEVRRVQLEKLRGVEDRCWVQVSGFERVFAIADEDMERENEVKTSAVHFLRFELSDAMTAKLKGGAALSAGIDHPEYQHQISPTPDYVRASLIADLG